MLQPHPIVLFKLYLFERKREKPNYFVCVLFHPMQYGRKVLKENKSLPDKKNLKELQFDV